MEVRTRFQIAIFVIIWWLIMLLMLVILQSFYVKTAISKIWLALSNFEKNNKKLKHKVEKDNLWSKPMKWPIPKKWWQMEIWVFSLERKMWSFCSHARLTHFDLVALSWKLISIYEKTFQLPTRAIIRSFFFLSWWQSVCVQCYSWVK